MRSDEKPTHPPVFPNSYPAGISLRDYFAAAALQGLASSHHELMDNAELVSKLGTVGVDKLQANMAYRLADSMLKARGV